MASDDSSNEDAGEGRSVDTLGRIYGRVRIAVSACSSALRKAPTRLHDTGGFSPSLWSDRAGAEDPLDREQLTTVSMFVFILATVLISISEISNPDTLITFLVEGDIPSSFGEDIDDNGSSRNAPGGPFSNNTSTATSISSLGRIAFIVVIGQVAHRVNVETSRLSLKASVIGLTIYSSSLAIAVVNPHTTLWILSTLVVILGYYAVVLVLIAVRSKLP